MKLLFLLSITIQCKSQILFVGKMTCVFTVSNILTASSLLDCANKCITSHCQVFVFDGTTSCKFYLLQQTCQSNTTCTFVKAFYNSKFPDNVSSPNTARFQLLKGINFQLPSSSLSPYTITNSAQTEPVLIGPSGGVQIGAGTNNNSKMVIWYTTNLISNMNSKSPTMEFLANNVVKYLTVGRCAWYGNCYAPIENYNTFVGVSNMVFGVVPSSSFNLTDFQTNAQLYQWHVIMTGNYFDSSMTNTIRSLLNSYGYCASYASGVLVSIITDNVCNQVTNIPQPCL